MGEGERHSASMYMYMYVCMLSYGLDGRMDFQRRQNISFFSCFKKFKKIRKKKQTKATSRHVARHHHPAVLIENVGCVR